ncbi:MAG: 4Fe-4S binding protein, partial [Dehalococcoidia bacterium]
MTTAETRQVIPPCEMACPAGIRVRDYVALIAQGRFQESIDLIRERMPFASACGRICRHPCEQECNRGLVDEPIAIMYLKRFASDYEFSRKPSPPPPPEKTKRQGVAIIGGGPCGLTAAQDLAGEGYPVTVIEAEPFAGGTVRLALARYRLPKDLVDWDISRVLALGIELRANTALGRDLSLPELQQEGYGAILLATGADRSRKLSQPEAGIFAEGDLAFGHMWTVDAVAAGHRAAQTLSSYLAAGSHTQAESVRVARRPTEELDDRVVRGQIRLRPRSVMPLWQKGGEALGAAEIEMGYTEEMALWEARRCLCCGSAEIDPERCVSCLTCLRVCPYEVPVIADDGLLRIREERCQACGICVGECPVKAIAYTMP